MWVKSHPHCFKFFSSSFFNRFDSVYCNKTIICKWLIKIAREQSKKKQVMCAKKMDRRAETRAWLGYNFAMPTQRPAALISYMRNLFSIIRSSALTMFLSNYRKKWKRKTNAKRDRMHWKPWSERRVQIYNCA